MIRIYVPVLRGMLLVIFCMALYSPLNAFGYVMGSGAYRIDSDSVNSGGLTFSTSSSYSLGSTLGEIGTGNSTSSSYRLYAGFWVPEDTYISISSPTDTNLGAISGLIGGTGEASSTWLVTTNNPTGYSLSVVSDTDPALKAPTAYIDDYTPAGGVPDLNFSIASDAAEFGFTPEGDHIIQRYRDDGSVCNAGSGNTSGTCWDGFSTSPTTIASGGSSNHPSGTETTIRYRVQIGSGKIQDSSPSYSASVTVTAIAL